MAVELANTDGDPFSDQISSGTGQSFAITIPADAEAVIFYVDGWNSTKVANEGLIDEANFDDLAGMDFTWLENSFYDSTHSDWNISAYIITDADSGWDGTGSKTLYWENRNTTWGEGFNLVAFSVKGLDTSTPVGQVDTATNDDTNQIDVTDNTANTLTVIGVYKFGAGGSGVTDTNSQTVVQDMTQYHSAGMSIAVKANESTMQYVGSDTDAVGFTLLPAAAGGSSIINQLQGSNLGADLYNGTIL